MSVFVVDKHTCKICQSTKDVFKALTSLGVLPLQIVQGVRVFMWDVLLLMLYDCMLMINRELITKDLILCTEYRGMRKTRVAVYKVPARVKGEALAVYFKKFG